MMPALSILPESLVVRQFGVPFAVHDDFHRLPVGKHLDPLRVFVSGVRLQLHEAGFRLRLPGFGFRCALLRFRRPRFRRRHTRFGFLRLALDLFFADDSFRQDFERAPGSTSFCKKRW